MNQTKDLTAASGLPLGLDLTTGELDFGIGTVSDPPGVRSLEELRPVLADADAESPEILSRLYRNVRQREDEAALREANLRYDVTVTLPGLVGQEFVKTSGHYHHPSPAGSTYPEVYEVLNGRAAFLLQWVEAPCAPEPGVKEVWVAVCKAGEKIVIPPDCGHVSVNVGEEPLAVADLVSRDSGHAYGSFRAAGGAAYYLMADGSAPPGFRLEPNPSYGELPEAWVLRGSRWEPFLEDRGPVYGHFLEEPADYAFLRATRDMLLERTYVPWTSAGVGTG